MDMFTEMDVSDHLAGDMFTKRVVFEEDVQTSKIDERDVFRSRIDGDVYTCPLVMSDSCNIDPIGLPDMLSGTAIRHLTETHGIPQTECTRNEFRFTCWKTVCSDIQATRTQIATEDFKKMENIVEDDAAMYDGEEGETAWGPDPLNTSEGPLDGSDPLDISEGLLDISQDPAVLACGNVVAGEEFEYFSGHCLPHLLPPSAPPMIGGEQLTADIKQEMNHVEVVYEAGFCLPRLIVKEEVQEDDLGKDLGHVETVQSGNISANST